MAMNDHTTSYTKKGSDDTTMTTTSSGSSSAATSGGEDDMKESWSAGIVADYNASITNNEVAPSDEEEQTITTTDINNEYDNIIREEKKEIEPIQTALSTDSSIIPNLSSPKNSPFRQSLDEEYRAKSRARELENEKLARSKQLLRESIDSLSNYPSKVSGGASAGGGGQGVGNNHESVLTTPERNFLERLLESNDAKACMAAHERLMDGNLFWAICGGAAGEVHDLIPGHGWTVKDSTSSLQQMNGAQTNGNNKSDWVQDWVSKGSQDSNNSKGSSSKNDNEEKSKETPKVTNKSLNSSNAESSTSMTDSTKALLRPYELQREKSSVARLNRLELRRRQSSVGSDNNRLFRAHEAGLAVTPSGSARRSLLRMGLPMEKGLHAPLNMPLKDSNIKEGGDDPNNNTMLLSSEQEAKNGIAPNIEKTTFEKALAKMDERTIRRIEKEERAKQKDEARKNNLSLSTNRPLTPVNAPGCISPFSMSILRRMFASKQFSFQRSSSSYTRFDSFLNTTDTADTGVALLDDETTVGLDVSDRSSEKNAVATNNDDIFRPTSRPSASDVHLRNLLINAGFKDEDEDIYDETDKVVDARSEDDADIMSTSTNSVAVLMKGGPSYRNVDMFRESPPDKKKKKEADSDDADLNKNEKKKGSPVKESPSDESDVGELPSKLPPSGLSKSERTSSYSSVHKRRGTTIGIIKSSSSSSPSRKSKYKRSVSWNHMVFAKEGGKLALSREESATSIASENLSVISFPNLGRAAPIRSDSIGSNISQMSLPPLRLGAPLRSDSTVSISSILSPVPSLARAQPVFSPRPSFTTSLPSISRATAVRSESQMTMATADLDDSASLNSVDFVDAKPNRPNGAAWESPLNKPPRMPSSSISTGDDVPVFIRQASVNNYEGEGIEVEDSPQVESVDKARKYRSMISASSWKSGRSYNSFRANSPPIMSLDDSFIVRSINFERHSSEILRSLSNEDLYSSHHVETINGGSSSRGPSSVARVVGDQVDDGESWDLESKNSYAANAWGVLEDEYAEGYGNDLPFQILGTSAKDFDCHPHVLSPPLMESLQNFFPSHIAETNFWLKYSLVRDGASLPSLLRHLRGTKHTIIAIETVEGEVFGSFTSSPWRKNWNYFGSGESFLWRMRRTRSEKDAQHSIIDQAKLESELDIYYWTGRNELVQYCTHDMIAVGGGSLGDDDRDDQPDEQRDLPPQNPVFTKAVDEGGFGLAIDSELLRGTSSSCATFQNPPLSKAHANGSPFEILNIEVWTMTPCANVADAENLEMKSLFLESYNRE